MPYNPNFIADFPIHLPTLSPTALADAYDNGNPIEHSRFSIIFNQKRSLASCTAHHMDGATLIPNGTIVRNDRFRLDPLIRPRNLQLDNDRGYRNNAWDRGHLVMRTSLHWGDLQEATTADSESFYWSNIAPQHENLHDTAWGSIEDWMLEFTDASDQRVSVFTGPVFTTNDPIVTNRDGEIPFQVPAGFWKIFALKVNGTLSASAFLVWQRDYDREIPLSFSPTLEQVRITTIEYLTGLMFTDLRDADSLLYNDEVEVNDAVVATRSLPPITTIPSQLSPITTDTNIPKSRSPIPEQIRTVALKKQRGIRSIQDLFISKTRVNKQEFKKIRQR